MLMAISKAAPPSIKSCPYERHRCGHDGQRKRVAHMPTATTTKAAGDSKIGLKIYPLDHAMKLEKFGQSKPELYSHLATLLANRLRDTNDSLAATSFLSIKGRFARALLRLADAFGREVGQGRIVIRQKVSQADLAAMTGIARENVNRLLHDWASRSLVTRSAGYYCLENLGELQREAED
jgi:CRP/FNR family transcriptional regulator, cyclic AMP receptor protein